VLLYTGNGQIVVGEALAAGAHALVFKDAPLDELVRAVKVVANGGIYGDDTLAGATPTEDQRPTLTARERDVLSLLAEGHTNAQAGRKLTISADTVQTHVRNAMKKLGADTRTQAVATAMRLSLIG
jgi:two-component system, NarL family, response regulator